MKKHEHLNAFMLYVLLIALFYTPVVFLNKTLQPAVYQPHGVVDGWPYGYKGRKPVNTFNIDLATPAYYEWPINKLVGDIYKSGGIPQWNPYQAAGTPLSVQYSSRVFFPYQIIEDISPVLTWDFFILGRLLVAGFFTYLFLRRLGIGFWPGMIGGILFMFSGSFVWFINLEEFTNNAMMTPVLLYVLETYIQKNTAPYLALSGITFGLVILSGQPEMALYVLFLGVCYYAFRVFRESTWRQCIKRLSKFAVIMVVGLGIAAPLIVPFTEFMSHSHHIHHIGGDMGTLMTGTRLDLAANLITPAISELPQDNRNYPKLLFATYDNGTESPFYFRISPSNEGQKHTSRLIFFTFFGSSILLKNFNIPPFQWLGKLPLFDMVWSQPWAGPVWTFSLAAAGAIAL